MRPSKFFSDNGGPLARYRSEYQLLSRSTFLLASILTLGLTAANVNAQVTPDLTMSENTTVSIDDSGSSYSISGGSRSGSNDELLFHSFNSFSIDEGQIAEFVTGDNITTIFSRVTGNNQSQIDGTIRAGAVDFFFLNPNGITFGPTASVDIGGSMVVSTAEAFTFADNIEFSSLAPQDAPILTVSQPVGLSLRETAGEIIINGPIGFLPDGTFLSDKTFLFVGNGITINRKEGASNLFSGVIIESGRVELVSVVPDSQVTITFANDTLSPLSIDESSLSNSVLGDISLLGSFMEVSGGPNNTVGGSIVLRGRRINMEEGSFIASFNYSDTLPGEGISISASEELEIDSSNIESNSSIAIRAEDLRIQGGAIVDGSSIAIRAEDLKVRGGARVSARDLIIQVPDGVVEVSGALKEDDIISSLSILSTRLFGQQSTDEEQTAAGGLKIKAQRLLVQSGGQIEAGTSGSFDSGGIEINATELVEVSGGFDGIQSAINTASNGPSSGNAGPLRISTDRLEITDGGQVFTSTSGLGNGGNLTVEAEEVVLSGAGTSPERSGLFARTRGPGSSGRLSVTTGSLEVRDGARLTVSTPGLDESVPPAEGFGRVRDAIITADSIVLDEGEITAESRSGDGGNLTFEVDNSIELRNNSLISATAGFFNSGGDGGIIKITTGYLFASPGGNSDILANAYGGTGGSIVIRAPILLGFESNKGTTQELRNNDSNDIAVVSEFGTDGQIFLDTVEINNLVELPAETTTLGQVAQRCLADSEGNNAFIITGQGGATPSPRDVIRNENFASRETGDGLEDSTATAFVEADGWHRDSNGTVVLVAQAPIATATSAARYHSCVDQDMAQSLIQPGE